MLVPSFFFFKETTKHKVGQASAGNWVLLMLFEKVKSVSFHFGKTSVRSSSTASQDSSVHQPYSAREWKPPVLFGNLLCYLETATGLSSSAFLSLTSTTFPAHKPTLLLHISFFGFPWLLPRWWWLSDSLGCISISCTGARYDKTELQN